MRSDLRFHGLNPFFGTGFEFVAHSSGAGLHENAFGARFAFFSSAPLASAPCAGGCRDRFHEAQGSRWRVFLSHRVLLWVAASLRAHWSGVWDGGGAREGGGRAGKGRGEGRAGFDKRDNMPGLALSGLVSPAANYPPPPTLGVPSSHHPLNRPQWRQCWVSVFVGELKLVHQCRNHIAA